MIETHPLGHWPNINNVSWSAALGVADSQRPEIKVSKPTIELEMIAAELRALDRCELMFPMNVEFS